MMLVLHWTGPSVAGEPAIDAFFLSQGTSCPYSLPCFLFPAAKYATLMHTFHIRSWLRPPCTMGTACNVKWSVRRQLLDYWTAEIKGGP